MYAASDWYHVATRPDGDGVTVERVVHYLDPESLVDHARELMARDPGLGEQDAIAASVGCHSAAIRDSLAFPKDFLGVPGWSCGVGPGRPDRLIESIGLQDGLPSLTCSHEKSLSR